jgi:sensor c-di-GMP phosphodiesterase-like protein
LEIIISTPAARFAKAQENTLLAVLLVGLLLGGLIALMMVLGNKIGVR